MKSKNALPVVVGFIGALAIGWYVFPTLLYKDEAQPLQFSHIIHTGEQTGLACEDCHAFTDDGRFQGIPPLQKCAECHAALLGGTEEETILIEEFVVPENEIPWRTYLRQPDNAYFSHAVHVKLARLKCEECHGPHGSSDMLPVFQVNRITGYSRNIWGRNISGFQSSPWEGMKMERCVHCHVQHAKLDGCIQCHK